MVFVVVQHWKCADSLLDHVGIYHSKGRGEISLHRRACVADVAQPVAGNTILLRNKIYLFGIPESSAVCVCIWDARKKKHKKEYEIEWIRLRF